MSNEIWLDNTLVLRYDYEFFVIAIFSDACLWIRPLSVMPITTQICFAMMCVSHDYYTKYNCNLRYLHIFKICWQTNDRSLVFFLVLIMSFAHGPSTYIVGFIVSLSIHSDTSVCLKHSRLCIMICCRCVREQMSYNKKQDCYPITFAINCLIIKSMLC